MASAAVASAAVASAAVALAAAVASAAAGEAAPVAGTAPPVGATTSLAVATLPVREPPPGSVEGDGVEETCSTCSLSVAVAVEEAATVSGAAPPSGSDNFPSGGNTPIERAAAGHCRG